MSWCTEVFLVVSLGLFVPIETLYGQDNVPTEESAEQEPLPLPFTISEETTLLTEPMTDDGFVDYAAILNAKCSEGVTPENNAEVLYLEAMGWDDADAEWLARYCELLGIEVPEADDVAYVSFEDFVAENADDFELEEPVLDAAREMFDAAESGPWTASDYPLVAAWLEENRLTLDLISEAAARPRCYRPLVTQEGGFLITTLLPTTFRQRDIVNLLAMQARLCLGEGDSQGAWDNLQICQRVAQHSCEGPTLIDALVGIAIDSTTCLAAVQLSQCEDLSANNALLFANTISEWETQPSLIDHIDEMERYSFLDTVCRLSVHLRDGMTDRIDLANASGDVNVAGWGNAVYRYAIDWDTVLIDGNLWYDRLVEAGRLEAREERKAALQKINDDLIRDQYRISDPWPWTVLRILWNPNPGEEIGHLASSTLVYLLTAGLSSLFDLEIKAAMNRDLARLAFVLAAYRDREMVYPERLEQLVPDYLPEIPVDRFTGKPLSYEGTASGYLAYSVGRNLQDDTLLDNSTNLDDDNSDDLRIHFHWEAEE